MDLILLFLQTPTFLSSQRVDSDIWGSPEDAPKHDGSLFESNAKCNFGNFDFRLDSIEDACQYSAFFYAVDLDYTDDIS